MARSEKWFDNVAASLLGLKKQYSGEDGTSADDFIDALDSKYTELKEKLFIDILKKYACISSSCRSVSSSVSWFTFSCLEFRIRLFLFRRNFGEEEWNKMSRQEQQQHIDKLRAEEAQLMNGQEVQNG